MLRNRQSIFYLIALGTILRVAEANQCLTNLEEVTPKRVVVLQEEGRSLDITFELSSRITQRLSSRIMKIFLVEVLGYPGVSLIEKDDQFDTFQIYNRLSAASSSDQLSIVPETMVNMEVWIPGQMGMSVDLEDYYVKDCGLVGPPGYFGWFVPRVLWESNMTEMWHTFADRYSASKFSVDEQILARIKEAALIPGSKTQHYCTEEFCQEGIYVPDQCADSVNDCAMLLAGDPSVTSFVKRDIERYKLFVRVAWVGEKLKNLSKTISDSYNTSGTRKSLVILHWTPSDVVPNERDFVSITFPRCRLRPEVDQCKYDDHRLVKLVWAHLQYIAKIAYQAIRRASFTGRMYEDLLNRWNYRELRYTEEDVACDWLKANLDHVLDKWKPKAKDKNTLVIGGIFPQTGDFYKAKSILVAATMAKEAINDNSTVLRDYDLAISAEDGKCKSEIVMKSFIQYVVHSYPSLIGILGPACSETLEPLVGVAKEYNTMIISYSAEGSSFDDRTKYPYFFRTIGENIQYKHVYLSILNEMKWTRVAALTEDGQKYTEYISHMQAYLQKNGITFVDNAKFPRTRNRDDMYGYLENLKKKRARIIIADVNDEVARQVMCEAYKLEMTAYEGYVWFLPLWLLPGWWDTDSIEKTDSEMDGVNCTSAEMRKAVNGHLGISHANYAPDDATMQENITVREWRDRYESRCRRQNQSASDYAGYAYDATWTYGYAMDKLIKENESYVFALHNPDTANRLSQIISQTDFQGVSGRIKFLNGASRMSSVEIFQYVNDATRKIGTFHPNLSDVSNEVVGGRLDVNVSAVVWLTPDARVPEDGSETELNCVLASFAKFLDVTCEVASVVVNIIGFGCLGILLIVGFVIVKRKYDEKVRLHEKYMKSLGIDLLQTDTSGLDKWEIPRECVVINRKLGEGAFGTVYGGEAFFTEKGWLAVAVKTLKVGSSTEEKLDFLSEVEVMKRFEHKNIIKLLGVCIKCEPVYTVMEFMLYGDLKTYLLARRHLVNDRNYDDYDEISSKKLTAMALDVARALSYLAQLKYVHRDIASRNCLVNAQRVVKLGDFGMTRPMYENDYYKFNRKGMLPVRWMSPESLGLGIFTPASDVWSYGVLLYEIITFGSFPFQGLSNNEVLDHVKSGNTITIPSGIKGPLENLIRSCWTIDHKSRPKAPEIVDFLATNPRLLSPCLDVPLASVQLEHTGRIEMQLPEKFRKFSVSLNRKSHLSSPKLNPVQSSRETPLIGIGEESIPSTDTSLKINSRYRSGPSTPIGDNSGSRLPLLVRRTETDDQNDEETRSKYVRLQRSISGRNDDQFSARYVNIQPGNEPGDQSIGEDSSDLDQRRINDPEINPPSFF